MVTSKRTSLLSLILSAPTPLPGLHLLALCTIFCSLLFGIHALMKIYFWKVASLEMHRPLNRLEWICSPMTSSAKYIIVFLPSTNLSEYDGVTFVLRTFSLFLFFFLLNGITKTIIRALPHWRKFLWEERGPSFLAFPLFVRIKWRHHLN